MCCGCIGSFFVFKVLKGNVTPYLSTLGNWTHRNDSSVFWINTEFGKTAFHYSAASTWNIMRSIFDLNATVMNSRFKPVCLGFFCTFCALDIIENINKGWMNECRCDTDSLRRLFWGFCLLKRRKCHSFVHITFVVRTDENNQRGEL